VLSFGSKITFGSVASSIATGAPEFLLGKLQSFTAAGLFSRAQGLVAMFDRLVTDAVYPVALSLFAKEVRGSHDAAPSFIKAMSYVTALSWSFAIAMIFLAHPVIRLLYGDQWDEAADLTRVLAGAMAFAAPVKLCHAALIAGGGATKILRATLISVALTLPLVVAGAVTGLLYLGVALLLAAALSAWVWLSATRSMVRFDWDGLGAELGRSLAVALAAGIAPACVILVWGARPEHLIAPLATGILGSGLAAVLALYATRHPFRSELTRIVPLAEKLLATCKRRFI
jgi:O-antigen/teichoic acid export membrane protein